MEKQKLLTIGEISKFTGSSIKSLRYYEQIGILKPDFINPETSYRYYSFDQIYLIEVIQFCVELDIPLKDLIKFIDQNETIDYGSLLSYGKKIAEKKLQMIQDGLKFIASAEHEINLVETYKREKKPYYREMKEKYFYATPCSFPMNESQRSKSLAQLFSELQTHESRGFELLDYGLFIEYFPTGFQAYVFVEVPKRMKALDHVKTIPAGRYVCQQNEEECLHQATHLFSELFKANDCLLVIESELFASRYQISKPIKELKAIGLYIR